MAHDADPDFTNPALNGTNRHCPTCGHEIACTCSSLSKDTDYRCQVHPDNRARTFDQRYEFEQDWDARYEAHLTDRQTPG